MDKYEQIVEQFTDELEKVGIAPLNQDVLVTLPVQSFKAFFSALPLIDALNKSGLKANLKTVRKPETKEEKKGIEKMSERGSITEDSFYENTRIASGLILLRKCAV